MAYRYDQKTDQRKQSEYLLLELVTVQQLAQTGKSSFLHVVLVDNNHETMELVRESMTEIVNNVMQAKKWEKG